MSKWWPVAEEWDRISLWGADWSAKRNRDRRDALIWRMEKRDV